MSRQLPLAAVMGTVLATALLVVAPVAPANAVPPGQNGRIAFVSDRGGGATAIYTENADGTGIRQVTHHSGIAYGDPAFSPDGRRIAFDGTAGGVSEIYVARADGTHLRQLTNDGFEDLQPSWSPDGRHLVLETREDATDTWRVERIDADGRHPVTLTGGGGTDALEASYSPDGRRIAFTSDQSGAYEIWTMHTDGSGPTRLTDDGDDEAPSWSPDGTSIVFEAWSGRRTVIAMTLADGSAGAQLTDPPGSSTADLAPSYSPDGRKIVFSSNRDHGYQNFVMNADGSGAVRITTPHDDSAPAWGPRPVRCAGRWATMSGMRHGDVLTGTPGPDVIAGLGGDDTIRGLGGDDVICGGAGSDRVYGGSGTDRLLGNTGADHLFARDHHRDARIDCGAGRDRASWDRRHDPRPVSCS